MTTKQGLLPLPTVRLRELHHGSMLAAPRACLSCQGRPCASADGIGSLGICPYGYNFYRFDSELTICGVLVESHSPGHPTPRADQKRFKRTRRAARHAREAGESSVFVRDSEWRSITDALEQWSVEGRVAERGAAGGDRPAALQAADSADEIRDYFREVTAELSSAVLHDLSQLATAISSAIENVIDLKYGDVRAATGWKQPAARPSRNREREREVWKREKAIFYLSDLLNIRLNIGIGLPTEQTLDERTSVSPHGMFLKIIEPYRLLAEPRRVRFEVSGSAHGKTLAPYDPFLVPALSVIDNALKYSPDALAVMVHFSEGDDEISVDVSSYGPRILDAEMDELFVAGFRGRHAEGVADGQGLGLWLARTLLADWGGDITAEQNPDPDPRSGAYLTTFSLRYERCR